MNVANKTVSLDDAEEKSCRDLSGVLSRVGDKWTILIVGALVPGPMRYNEIRRAVEGISQRMLTLTLKALEEDGLINRTMYPTIPPRVDYELTELGRSFIEPLQVMYSWVLKHRPEIEASRQRFANVGAKKKRLIPFA